MYLMVAMINTVICLGQYVKFNILLLKVFSDLDTSLISHEMRMNCFLIFFLIKKNYMN